MPENTVPVETAAFEWEISSRQKWFQLHLGEIWDYRDLIARFVRRDLLSSYQQTILGPLWIFLQPLLTTLVYFLIFSKVARIPTNGIPPILFYLPSSILWTFFNDCLTSSMNTFLYNSGVFSKVYFPRLVMPISSTLFQGVRLSIQLLLFVIVYCIALFIQPNIHPTIYILLVPALILLTALFALGLGLTISVFTAKYRDLDTIVQFMLRLFMFATPVFYPASIVPAQYKSLYMLNPLASIIETFRAVFYSNAPIDWWHLGMAAVITVFFLFTGAVLFKKRELKIMDIL